MFKLYDQGFLNLSATKGLYTSDRYPETHKEAEMDTKSDKETLDDKVKPWLLKFVKQAINGVVEELANNEETKLVHGFKTSLSYAELYAG